eukprot:superscaffoldBa00001880_g12373
MADSRQMKLDFTLKELTLSCHSEDVPGSSSTVELQDKKLVCVEYPAVVNSVSKMLETLGGDQAVSKTFAHPNRRLELRYRPQDPFCHSLCGNRFPSSNLLLRVRRRVRKSDPKDAEINMDVLGVIGTTQMPLNKNFIGLNRARRPHNAIFVSFTEPTVPTECLEAAKVNWIRVCLKERDKQAEEQLKTE